MERKSLQNHHASRLMKALTLRRSISSLQVQTNRGGVEKTPWEQSPVKRKLFQFKSGLKLSLLKLTIGKNGMESHTSTVNKSKLTLQEVNLTLQKLIQKARVETSIGLKILERD